MNNDPDCLQVECFRCFKLFFYAVSERITPLTKLGELGTYAIKNEILAPALQDLT